MDQAVLLVDGSTSAEHLYVGLTRGRDHNLACVVCEPVDDEHQRTQAPSAREVLAAALRRSSSELSATETIRAGLDHTKDFAGLQASLEEARRQIDAAAGPDRNSKITLLRPQADRHPELVQKLADAEQQLVRLRAERQSVAGQLAQAHQAEQDAQHKRGWLRGPDRNGQAAAVQAANSAARRLIGLDDRVQRAQTILAGIRHQHDQARDSHRALQAAMKAQQARQVWLDDHPDVVAHVSDLARQIEQIAKANGGRAADARRRPVNLTARAAQAHARAVDLLDTGPHQAEPNHVPDL